MSHLEPIDNSHRRLSKIVYNDDLGYAIVYYKPIINLEVKPHKPKQVPRRRHLDTIAENPSSKRFSDEVAGMIRKKENENLKSDIRETCNNVRELFKRCEQYDMSRREILNDKVKSRIRGKSADQICDILVEDALQHVKYIYQNDRSDTIPHKILYKIAAASVKRCPSPDRTNKYFEHLSDDDSDTDDESNNKKYESVHKCTDYALNRNIDSEIFDRKYGLSMDKVRRDLIHTWGRCYD